MRVGQRRLRLQHDDAEREGQQSELQRQGEFQTIRRAPNASV
jgi:hypothetical protein